MMSKLTARKAEPLRGEGMLKKRMPSLEREQEYITGRIGQYPTRKGADLSR